MSAIYDSFMNLATEVGELEARCSELEKENNLLKGNSAMMHDFNRMRQDLEKRNGWLDNQVVALQADVSVLLAKNDKLKSDLIAYETANWVDRLRYFFYREANKMMEKSDKTMGEVALMGLDDVLHIKNKENHLVEAMQQYINSVNYTLSEYQKAIRDLQQENERYKKSILNWWLLFVVVFMAACWLIMR